ncbi:MAG: flavodoxin [Bacteroidales bacterium]|jgi:flavodoxin I|nr:flavodoxin [Bacteroidales bacterium]
MSKIGIFYGSSSGNTQGVAKRIASKLGIDNNDIHDIRNAKAIDWSIYDVLLFGSSTWGLGDLQDDWEDFIKTVASANLSGKTVALFGCGDSSSYADTFCDAIGKIYEAVKDKAAVIGFTETAGYSFDASQAVIDNQFVGLPIDEDNESNLTEERINNWTDKIRAATA